MVGGGGLVQFGGGGMGGAESGFGGGGGGGRRGGDMLGAIAGRLQMAGRLQQNRPRGQATYNLGGSPFNAEPYALNGQSTGQPTNIQQRFGATIGGPFKIKGLFDAGPRVTFFLSYSGNHGTNLQNSYSRVPALAQRAGDFSASSTTVLDPLTGLPFAGNRIPAGRISAAANALLPFIPVPNQEGVEQNFHYATTTVSHSDDINFRFIRSFGAAAQRGRGGQGGGGRGGGRGGAGGGASNVSVGLQFRWSTGEQTTSFPTTGGKNKQTAWNVPVNYTFQKWGVFNTVNAQFNRNRSTTTNLFAFTRNVAGEAGIVGVSEDPSPGACRTCRSAASAACATSTRRSAPIGPSRSA